jgi:hypothetical protein
MTFSRDDEQSAIADYLENDRKHAQQMKAHKQRAFTNICESDDALSGGDADTASAYGILAIAHALFAIAWPEVTE